MFCEQCGAELKEGGMFCVSCGHKQGEAVVSQPQTNGWTAEQEDFSYPTFSKSVNYISSTGATGFVEPDEMPLYSLANGLVNHMITGRGTSSDDAVLTNKRLYYSFQSGIINKVNNEEIVDLRDITGTKIYNNNPAFLMFIGVLALIASFILISGGETGIGLIVMGVALFNLFFYFIKRDTILSIEYAGGFIDFSMKSYGLNNVRTFQRCIYAAKEIQRTEELDRVRKVSIEEPSQEG